MFKNRKTTRDPSSNFGLMEEIMDMSCIHLAIFGQIVFFSTNLAIFENQNKYIGLKSTCIRTTKIQHTFELNCFSNGNFQNIVVSKICYLNSIFFIDL